MNEKHRTRLGKEWAPDRNDEYLFYQTLLGAWAGEGQGFSLRDLGGRLQQYMLKAIKEDKLHTSWISANEAYENGVAHFGEGVMAEDGSHSFWTSFAPFARRIGRFGM